MENEDSVNRNFASDAEGSVTASYSTIYDSINKSGGNDNNIMNFEEDNSGTIIEDDNSSSKYSNFEENESFYLDDNKSFNCEIIHSIDDNSRNLEIDDSYVNLRNYVFDDSSNEVRSKNCDENYDDKMKNNETSGSASKMSSEKRNHSLKDVNNVNDSIKGAKIKNRPADVQNPSNNEGDAKKSSNKYEEIKIRPHKVPNNECDNKNFTNKKSKSQVVDSQKHPCTDGKITKKFSNKKTKPLKEAAKSDIRSKEDNDVQISSKGAGDSKNGTKKDVDSKIRSKNDADRNICSKRDADSKINSKKDAGCKISSKKDTDSKISSNGEKNKKIHSKEDDDSQSSSKEHGDSQISSKGEGESEFSSKKGGNCNISLKMDADSKIYTKEDTDSQMNSKKDVGKINSKKDVGKINSKKDVGKINSNKNVGKINSKKDVGKINSKKDVGCKISSKEDTGSKISSKKDVSSEICSKGDADSKISSKEEAGSKISLKKDESSAISSMGNAGNAISSNEDAGSKISLEKDANRKISSIADADSKISSIADADSKISSKKDGGSQISSKKDARKKNGSNKETESKIKIQDDNSTKLQISENSYSEKCQNKVSNSKTDPNNDTNNKNCKEKCGERLNDITDSSSDEEYDILRKTRNPENPEEFIAAFFPLKSYPNYKLPDRYVNKKVKGFGSNKRNINQPENQEDLNLNPESSVAKETEKSADFGTKKTVDQRTEALPKDPSSILESKNTKHSVKISKNASNPSLISEELTLSASKRTRTKFQCFRCNLCFSSDLTLDVHKVGIHNLKVNRQDWEHSTEEKSGNASSTKDNFLVNETVKTGNQVPDFQQSCFESLTTIPDTHTDSEKENNIVNVRKFQMVQEENESRKQLPSVSFLEMNFTSKVKASMTEKFQTIKRNLFNDKVSESNAKSNGNVTHFGDNLFTTNVVFLPYVNENKSPLKNITSKNRNNSFKSQPDVAISIDHGRNSKRNSKSREPEDSPPKKLRSFNLHEEPKIVFESSPEFEIVFERVKPKPEDIEELEIVYESVSNSFAIDDEQLAKKRVQSSLSSSKRKTLTSNVSIVLEDIVKSGNLSCILKRNSVKISCPNVDLCKSVLISDAIDNDQLPKKVINATKFSKKRKTLPSNATIILEDFEKSGNLSSILKRNCVKMPCPNFDLHPSSQLSETLPFLVDHNYVLLIENDSSHPTRSTCEEDIQQSILKDDVCSPTLSKKISLKRNSKARNLSELREPIRASSSTESDSELSQTVFENHKSCQDKTENRKSIGQILLKTPEPSNKAPKEICDQRQAATEDPKSNQLLHNLGEKPEGSQAVLGKRKPSHDLKDELESSQTVSKYFSFKKSLNVQSSSSSERHKTIQDTSKSPKLVQTSSKSPKLVQTSSKSPKLVQTSSKSPKLVQTSSKSPKLVQTSSKSPKLVQTSSKSQKLVQTSSKSQKPIQASLKSHKIKIASTKSHEPSEALSESLKLNLALSESHGTVEASSQGHESNEALSESLKPNQTLSESHGTVEASSQGHEVIGASSQGQTLLENDEEPTKRVVENPKSSQDQTENREPIGHDPLKGPESSNFILKLNNLDKALEEFCKPCQITSENSQSNQASHDLGENHDHSQAVLEINKPSHDVSDKQKSSQMKKNISQNLSSNVEVFSPERNSYPSNNLSYEDTLVQNAINASLKRKRVPTFEKPSKMKKATVQTSKNSTKALKVISNCIPQKKNEVSKFRFQVVEGQQKFLLRPTSGECPYCRNMVGNTDWDVKNHISQSHRHKCSACKKLFQTEEQYTQHKYNFHMNQLHECVICDDYFQSNATYVRHLNTLCHKRMELKTNKIIRDLIRDTLHIDLPPAEISTPSKPNKLEQVTRLNPNITRIPHKNVWIERIKETISKALQDRQISTCSSERTSNYSSVESRKLSSYSSEGNLSPVTSENFDREEFVRLHFEECNLARNFLIKDRETQDLLEKFEIVSFSNAVEVDCAVATEIFDPNMEIDILNHLSEDQSSQTLSLSLNASPISLGSPNNTIQNPNTSQMIDQKDDLFEDYLENRGSLFSTQDVIDSVPIFNDIIKTPEKVIKPNTMQTLNTPVINRSESTSFIEVFCKSGWDSNYVMHNVAEFNKMWNG